MIITKSVYEQFVTITELVPFENGVLIAQFDVGQNRFDKQDLLNSDSFFVSYQDAQDILDILNTDEKFFDKTIDREHHCIELYVDIEEESLVYISLGLNRIRDGLIYQEHVIFLNCDDHKDFFEGLQKLVEAHNEAH